MISGAGSVPRSNGSESGRDVQKHPDPEPQHWSKPNLVTLLASSQMTFSAAQMSALAVIILFLAQSIRSSFSRQNFFFPEILVF
jgi:hypothetical protein